jgi:hypothetical protein
LAPLLFIDKKPASELSGLHLGNLTASARQYYLWHNRKIGALRLTQERSSLVSCPNKKLQAAFGRECSTEAPNLLPSLLIEPSQLVQNPLKAAEDQTKWIRFLNADGTVANVMDYLSTLEVERWIDERTTRAELTFVLYNGPKDLIVYVSLTFVFARSGHIWKDVTHQTVVMLSHFGWKTFIWDFLFFFSNHLNVLFRSLRNAQATNPE